MLEVAPRTASTFDTVQMPLNVLDAHFHSFERGVLPRSRRAGHRRDGDEAHGRRPDPQPDISAAEECLRYAMSLPLSVTITGCETVERVEQALRVARGFQPLTEAEVTALLDKTRPAGETGADERYKTTESYDGTTQNPEWLG